MKWVIIMKKILLVLVMLFGLVFSFACKKPEVHIHEYQSVVTDPTCKAIGFTTFTCECGYTYKGNYVDELGHSFEEGVCTKCSEKDPNYVPEDMGGLTTGIKAEAVLLDSTNQTVVFNYVLNKENSDIIKDFNSITKIGYKAYVSGKEYSKEIDFEKVANVYSYSFTMDNEFTDNYSDEISISVYYKYINNKGNEKVKYSNEEVNFSFYDLAKSTTGEFSESILTKCEPNNIVRLDLTYNDEECLINTTTEGCVAEIVSVEGKDVIINITSDSKAFSENLRMYFNGKPAVDFIVNGNVVEYKTKTETVTEVNIELDEKEYVILNNDSNLYNLYVLEETGSDVIKVIIELKDNNILSPFATVTLNNEEVEFTEYESGSYIVTIADERITTLELDFDIDSFEFNNTSDKYGVLIERDANYDDIEVKVTANEGYEFSKRIKIVINKKVYLLSEVEFTNKEIKVIVEDDRITKLEVEVDTKEYTVLTEETDLYRFYVLEETGSELINVVVVLKANIVFAKYVKVLINGEEVELREYESGNYIASIIDQRITLFDFDFDSSNLSFDHVNDKYDVTINRDNSNNIVIKAAVKEGLEFSKRMSVIVNDTSYKLEDISFSDEEIIITIKDNVVTKVYITLNCVNLDPDNYNASTIDTKYSVELIPDKPNYEYIYIVVTLNEGYEFGSEVKVYVNNKEVNKKMFKITENTLKYTQDDPNWTDIF